MRKSFKDSLKALEADIQHANTLASDYPREYDGGCVQMRLSYSPTAQFFLFFIQWSDCNLAGALGLLRILIYKVINKHTQSNFGFVFRFLGKFPCYDENFYPALVLRLKNMISWIRVYVYHSFHFMILQAYEDGKTSISIHERKASIKEFYGVIFPSLLQLQRGITEVEDRKQKELCTTKYQRKDAMNKGKLSEIDMEREEECGICLEMNSMVVLPDCNHSLCMKCYRSWRSRSQSCPFCRINLKRVNSDDLWIYVSEYDVLDLYAITKENLKTLIVYIEKLPLINQQALIVGASY